MFDKLFGHFDYQVLISHVLSLNDYEVENSDDFGDGTGVLDEEGSKDEGIVETVDQNQNYFQIIIEYLH